MIIQRIHELSLDIAMGIERSVARPKVLFSLRGRFEE